MPDTHMRDIPQSVFTLDHASSTTGLELADFTVTSFDESGYIADPVTTLGLSITEVDALNAPGKYLVRFTPRRPELTFVQAIEGAHSYPFEVKPALTAVVDPSAEGDLQLSLESSGGSPIQGAVVRVYDSSRVSLVARGTTDASGEASFPLPVGTYYVRSYKDGYVFDNPSLVTVGANEAEVPIIYSILPASVAAGGAVMVCGSLLSQDSSEILFAAESPASAEAVTADGTVLLVTVPSGLSSGPVSVRVRKPDPDTPGSYLVSNLLTLVIS